MESNFSVKIKKIVIVGSISFFFLGVFFVYQSLKFNDGKLHVVFCDVGQGDAVFIRTPKGSDILVDGGPNDSVLSCLANNMPFWDRDLELVISTHPDADHSTGLVSVIKRYSVLSFAMANMESSTNVFKELIKSLDEKNINRKFLKEKDRFVLTDDLILETEWPRFSKSTASVLGAATSNSNTNEFSLIELLTFGDFSLLLTGDAEIKATSVIARRIGKVNILKVSHHGSKTGTDKEILKS